MSQVSYLDTFVPSKRSLENPNLPLNDPSVWEEAGLLVGRTKSGVRITHKKALGHAPIWRGVNLISNAVGKVRLFVYKNRADSGREKDKAHAAYPLLRRKPCKYVTAGNFKKTLTYHACFYGNGYAAIFRDGRGRPVELLILSPFDTFPVQKNGELWYVTTIAGKQARIPAEDVFHIKGLSFDGLVGHSVIEVLAEALSVGVSARDFAARFFGQGANASGILMIPGHLKPAAQQQAIKDFEKIASGIKNQHRVGILQDNVKWQPLTINPEQSQMLGVQHADLITVANVLGMPAYKLGHEARTSYASIEWESQAYIRARDLRSGHSTQCRDCGKADSGKSAPRKHGHRTCGQHTRTYNSWIAMSGTRNLDAVATASVAAVWFFQSATADAVLRWQWPNVKGNEHGSERPP